MFLIPVLSAVPRSSPFGPRFVPSGLAIDIDGKATGRRGQVRSRNTTSGSHAVASSRIPRLRSCRVFCSLISGFVHFKYALQLLLFQLLHNTFETISVFAVHTDAMLLKQQRMFVVGAEREQVCYDLAK